MERRAGKIIRRERAWKIDVERYPEDKSSDSVDSGVYSLREQKSCPVLQRWRQGNQTPDFTLVSLMLSRGFCRLSRQLDDRP